jgi:hypothetical protein
VKKFIGRSLIRAVEWAEAHDVENWPVVRNIIVESSWGLEDGYGFTVGGDYGIALRLGSRIVFYKRNYDPVLHYDS